MHPSGLTFDYLLNEKPEGDYYQEKEYNISDDQFRTPSYKIEIYSEALEKAGFNPLPDYQEPERSPMSWGDDNLEKYPLILSTGNRSYYYTHSQHRNIQALKEEHPEPMSEMGPETAQRFGISDGDDIEIETNRGHVKMKAHVEDRVAEGIVFVPHGWPGEANANLLTDAQCRECILGYPDMKSLMCTIRKA